MMGSYVVLILFAFLVEGVFGDAEEVKSVNDGDPVILNTDDIKGPNDMVRWYFNGNLIALINGDPKATCLYDGEDGRFRDKLMLDCKTGSLIITNITATHAGRYEAELKGEDLSGKSEILSRNPKCVSTKIYKKNINPEDIKKTFNLTVSALDSGKNKNEAQKDPQDKEKKICSGSGLSSGAVAGICVGVAVVVVVLVGVLLWAAAVVGVVKFTHCSIFDQKNKQVLKQMSEDKSILQAENGKV